MDRYGGSSSHDDGRYRCHAGVCPALADDHCGGGIGAPEGPAYILIVFGVGILLGERAGVATAVACTLTGLVLVWAEMSGHLPVSMVHYTPLSRWVAYGLYMAVIICLQYLANHTIRGSLQRTRQELEERKQVEIALQAEKGYVEKLIQTANAIVVGLDTRGNVTVFNQAAEEITGYTHAELKNRNWFEVIVPRDRYPETWAEFERLAEGGLPIRFENPILTKSGEERYIVWQNAALYEQSRIVGSISFGMDITEHKRAEEALLASEARLKAQYQGSPIPTSTWQKKGKAFELVGYNQAAEVASKGEVIKYLGKTTDEMYQDRPEILEDMHRCFTEKEVIQRELQSQHFMLGRTIVNTYAFVPPDLIMVHTEDITERKRTEEALYESEEKYRNVVEHSLAGVYIVQDNLFRFVNKRWCEMLGYTYEEAVDTFGPIDTAYPEDKKIVEENIRRRLTGEADHIEYDFRTVRKDGKVLNVKVLGSLTIYKGRTAVTGNIIDITREKTLESQLLQAQKMEAIGTLAGGIAHDFNNILTAVIGYGRLLQMKMDDTDPLKAYVAHILSSSEKAANLIKNLLVFSRKQAIELKPMKTSKIVNSVEKLLKSLLTEDIELKVILSGADITVMADTSQMIQVLLNLATNARDAMPKGGRLTIETKEVELTNTFIQNHDYDEPDRYALISVTDIGVGMDPKTKDKIFEPFFTTKEVGRGTGLGLSIVYGIIKQHRGHITVYSEPQMGTTFHIYLPVVKTAIEEKEALFPVAKGGTEMILVAEDNEQVRNLIREIFSNAGYTIVEAIDGKDAVKKFTRHNDTIALLFLDVVMPGKNGREAYDEIKKVRPDIKVIFTSGYTGDVVIDKGILEREYDFIPKPLSSNELLLKVREVLDR